MKYPPNRIKALRTRFEHPDGKVGISSDELARARGDGTDGSTIRRIENSAMQLTDTWMYKIARALKVRPADLVYTNLQRSDLHDNDVEQIEPIGLGASAKVLAMEGLAVYRVLADSVVEDGLNEGDTIMVRTGREPKTGDIVLVQVVREDDADPVLVLRIFIAPALLTTNRGRTNTTLRLQGEVARVEILGVVVRAN